VGFFGRRKSIPRLDALLPEEERKIEGLIESSQNIPWEDDSEDIHIELYEEAVRKEPQEFIYHYILGTAYFSRGELEKAKEVLGKASSLKPNDPRPLYNLGVIYYGIRDVRIQEQSGRTTEQEYRRIKEILSNYPFLPDDLRRSGEDLVREFENKIQPDYERTKYIRDSYRESPISRESATANALSYFTRVLELQLHPEDREAVEQHIKLIKQVDALP